MYLKSVFPTIVFSCLHEKPTGKIRQNHLYMGKECMSWLGSLGCVYCKFCQILIDLGGEGSTLFKPVSYLFSQVSVTTGSKMSVSHISKMIALVVK